MSDHLEPERTFTPAELGFGVLFIRAREAVVVANAQSGRIVLWNPAAVRMFGRTGLEAIGQLREPLFAKHVLPESTLTALGTVANVIALAVDRSRRLGA